MEFQPFYLHTNRVTYFNDFSSKNIDYVISIQEIKHIYDAGICLQEGFTLSKRGVYEVNFDIRQRSASDAYFVKPSEGNISAIPIIRHVERALIAHYRKYHAGMYVFLANDEKLSRIYQRIVRKHFAKGNTLESGFQPNRRGYVIRTPQCYL
ncbi:hypothetical protein ACFL9S_10580 [Erwinia sp. AnSW2-5]|uniref:hypothetical protein n=1 Tax=Erwinia sp. AnSW2-5 TaxID=3367692 RepID=UPI00385917BB